MRDKIEGLAEARPFNVGKPLFSGIWDTVDIQ